MRKGMVLVVIIAFSSLAGFAQESKTGGQNPQTMPGLFENLPDSVNILDQGVIKKGKITLYNGTEIRFSALAATKDSVSFLTRGKKAATLPLSAIRIVDTPRLVVMTKLPGSPYLSSEERSHITRGSAEGSEGLKKETISCLVFEDD